MLVAGHRAASDSGAAFFCGLVLVLCFVNRCIIM